MATRIRADAHDTRIGRFLLGVVRTADMARWKCVNPPDERELQLLASAHITTRDSVL